MSEHRPGEGGSANTPPFPRLVQDDAEERTADTTPVPASSSSSSTERIHIVAEAVARPEIRELPIAGRGEEAPPALKAVGPTDGEDDDSDDLGDLVIDAADQVRRAGRSVNRGFQNVADQLEDLADRLDSVAGLGEARGAAQLATAARRASTVLGDSALYFRTKDVKEMRGDLEEQVRSKPVKTLAMAVAAGWLVGKIVR
jgi:ElaB/YqjD/DUF883 family membrane-anchored ribosome-binding protein